MRCPPISQHHRRGRRVGAEVSRLINEAGHAPRIGAGNGALGQETARGSGARPAHWGKKRRIGADNGPGIRGTPRALGQATAHWGRQIAYSNACFPAPMRLTVLGGALQPWSRATECAQERTVGAQIIDGDNQRRLQTASNTRPVGASFSQRYRDPRGRLRGLSRTAALFSKRYHTFTGIPHFASVITLAKWGIPLKNSASLTNHPAPAQRTRETLGFRGKLLANHPQQARLPFENTTSLAKQPEPRP